jgi:hypothetical protein
VRIAEHAASHWRSAIFLMAAWKPLLEVAP